MKKVTILTSLLALAIAAGAQTISVRPNAHNGVGPTARPSAHATNSTVVLPSAVPGPNAVNGGKKK
jgi:hypothetical protein